MNRSTCAVLFTLLSAPALAAPFTPALNDSGQTQCYDGSAMVACTEANTGDSSPYPRQDGQFGRDAQATAGKLTKIGGGSAGFDFTKIANDGSKLPASATEWYCVRDNVTGLTWSVETASKRTWDEAKTYAASVNSSNRCGYTDWRLPGVTELHSITHSNKYNPSIDASYFPNTVSDYYYYWTSTSVASDPASAWVVAFDDGNVYYNFKANAYAVRVVRASQSYSFLSFIDNQDGTITQNGTGLVWSKCSIGQTYQNNTCTGTVSHLNGSDALKAAKNSSLAGKNDWRLPNPMELQSLVDYSVYSPAINRTFFPSTDNNYYWTSTSYAAPPDAWLVNFNVGNVYNHNKTNAYAVRVVRASQCFSLLSSFCSSDPAKTYTLLVTKLGTGTGTVTSNPAGINCGKTCSKDYNSGTSVTLTAAAATGSTFAGWGGSDCSGTGTCTVKMTAGKGVTATFTPASNLDFAVTNVSIRPAVPAANSTFTATVTIKNQGTVDGIVGTVGVWANQATAQNCGATPDKSVTVDTLAAGESTTVLIKGLAAGKVGAKTVRIFADSTCATLESNEDNNQVTQNYTVGPPLLPDFTVTRATLNPTSPSAKNSFRATVTVKNQGNAAGDGGYLDIWANQSIAQTCGSTGDNWVSVGTLAAGESKSFTLDQLPAGTAGTKTLRVFADSWCENKESNDTNNQFTMVYTVANRPDFIVTSVVFSPAAPTANGKFNATVTVKNQGTASGDAGSVDLWADAPTTQACGALGDNAATVGILTSGQSKTFSAIRFSAGAAGNKTFRAFVDSQCGTTESNDANNQSTKNYTIR